MAKRPRKSTLVTPEQQASPPAEHGDAIITLPEPSNTPESSEAERQALLESTISTRAAFLLLIGALSRDAQRFASWCKPLAIKTAHSAITRLQGGLARFNEARASLVQRTRYNKGASAHPQAPVADVQAEGEPRPVPPRDVLATRLRRNVVVALATATALMIAGTAALMFWALHDVPFDEIASGHAPNQVIALAAADGQPLIQRGPYQEVAATREQFPDHLVNAVLATEDRRFYDHWGVDVWGIIRALSRNLFAGEVREGGSTITQQLLKVLYLEPDRTMRRKVQDSFCPSGWKAG